MKHDSDLLTPSECERLLTACGASSTGRRNAALVVLMWRAGLRVSEAMDVRVKDIDWSRGTVRVLHGKGDKARTSGLGALGLAVCRQWLERRRSLGLKDSDGPFCSTLKGGRLPYSYPREMVSRLGRRSGLTKRCHPHGLRHAFCTELVAEGARLTDVQLLAGHTSAATTARYLARLGATSAVELAAARA